MVEKQTDLTGAILKVFTDCIVPNGSQTETAKPFTTEPKKRKHLKHSISGHRAKDFMEHLWRKGFRESCHYKALRINFITYFETNDPRVIQKYIGRPKNTKRYSGSSVVRQNRNTGTIAYFMYSNKKEIEPKNGLMELLGYLTLDKKTGLCTLHHETFHYFSQQTILNDSLKTGLLKPRDERDNGKVSKQNLCVRPIDVDVAKRRFVFDVGNGEGEREERESNIDCTHKSGESTVKPNMEEPS